MGGRSELFELSWADVTESGVAKLSASGAEAAASSAVGRHLAGVEESDERPGPEGLHHGVIVTLTDGAP